MDRLEPLISSIQLFDEHCFSTCKITPIRIKQKAPAPDVMSFETAHQSGLCEVAEISPSGAVNNIAFSNNSLLHIFVREGTNIIGAKQNRTFSKSFIAPPNSETVVPVQCVERGRWDQTFDLRFKPTDLETPRNLKKAKIDRLRSDDAEAIQTFIWDDVKEYSGQVGIASSSEDLLDVIKQTPSNKHQIEKINDIDNANGYFIISENGSSLEMFSSEVLCAQYLENVIASESQFCGAPINDNNCHNANNAVSRFINLPWILHENIGCETSYFTKGSEPGHSITLNGSVIHSVVYF